jgi:MFS transporter, DHA2 family, multidrug resistance protein
MSPRNTHPVVDFRVLNNRSLTGGIILFVVTGFGLCGVTYLYPLLAQTIEGMTSLQTGVALLPGGLATAFGIVFCGVVSTNPKTPVDARGLTFLGILFSATAMWQLAHLSPASSVDDTFWPMLIRGLSIGFLIIPVNQLAISSLKPSEVTQGTGLLGLARQLGGSIGIAVLATYLSNQAQVSRANVVGYMSPANPAFAERLSGLTGTLAQHGYSYADAQQGALALLDRTVSLQATSIAFNETFLLLLLLSVLTAPVLFLIRRAGPGGLSTAMH